MQSVPARVLPLLIFLLAGMACTWPRRYSDHKSGRITDLEGKALPGTYVLTKAFRDCGSLGGSAKEELKSSFALTDDAGHYSRSISGWTWLSAGILNACPSVSIQDYACRHGSGCKSMGAESDFKLEQGKEGLETILRLPPEVRAATVSGCVQRPLAKAQRYEGWVRTSSLKILWYCSKDVYPVAEVQTEPLPDGWLRYVTTYENHGLKVNASLLPGGIYKEAAADVPHGSESRTILFALEKKHGAFRPIAAIKWGHSSRPGIGQEPIAPSVPERYDWTNMLVYAKEQIDPTVLKWLPTEPPPK